MDHPDIKEIDYLQDATLRRYKICFNLYWKTLKKFLASEGVELTTPKDVFRKAYQFNLIDDEKMWIQMLHNWDRMLHLYTEEEAKIVLEKIFTYGPILEKNYEKLQDIFYQK